jgi:hypothetical protein
MNQLSNKRSTVSGSVHDNPYCYLYAKVATFPKLLILLNFAIARCANFPSAECHR